MNLSPEKTNLDVFSDTLLSLGLSNRDLIVVTGDSRGSGKLTKFGKTLPEQLIEIGIAEQNLVGVSAGLSSMGKVVFAVSPASFLCSRALEQIKNDVAYSNFPVKLIGISAGVSYGPLGSTHHSMHDFSALLAISGIDIVVPSDNFETRNAIMAAFKHPNPIYIRLGKKAMPNYDLPNNSFRIGKGLKLVLGNEAYIIACGETVLPALIASKLLAKKNISCGVVSMHSLKPFDFQLLHEIASTSKAIITCEEHSIHGGLGSICASYLAKNSFRIGFKMMGLPEEFVITGTQEEVFDFYGINAESLAENIENLIVE